MTLTRIWHMLWSFCKKVILHLISFFHGTRSIHIFSWELTDHPWTLCFLMIYVVIVPFDEKMYFFFGISGILCWLRWSQQGLINLFYLWFTSNKTQNLLSVRMGGHCGEMVFFFEYYPGSGNFRWIRWVSICSIDSTYSIDSISNLSNLSNLSKLVMISKSSSNISKRIEFIESVDNSQILDMYVGHGSCFWGWIMG